MDRNLGTLECVASDRPLSQGNRRFRGGEPVVHVFLVALCTHSFVIDIGFTHLTRS